VADSETSAHHLPHGDITGTAAMTPRARKAVTMQRRTSRRTMFGALAVLAAMVIGMLAWSPAATAEQRHGPSHNQHRHVAQKHVAQKHSAHKNSAQAKGQQGKQSGKFAANAKSPFDDLLNGLIGDKGVAGKHGPVSKVVNDTVPKAVKKAVDSTTSVVNTTLGRSKGTAPAPKPPSPPSTAPGHAPAPTHAPATNDATQHAAATSTTATRDDAATIRTAPLDSPALLAVRQPAGEKAVAPSDVQPPRAAALTPASLLSAPGTGILVGVMFAFAAGVFAVVYGGGYRGRRTR
jgi:hypothetical protein